MRLAADLSQSYRNTASTGCTTSLNELKIANCYRARGENSYNFRNSLRALRLSLDRIRDKRNA